MSRAFWNTITLCALLLLVAPPVSAQDTQPPTAPGTLTATAASNSQINLAWTASTDNVAVTGYLIQRCQRAGCATFVQVAAPAGTGTTYSDPALLASTSYGYRVRASDAAANRSAYSGIATAVTQAVVITFVQANAAVLQTPQPSVAVPFTSAQVVGDLKVVAVGWSDSTTQVPSVTDTN